MLYEPCVATLFAPLAKVQSVRDLSSRLNQFYQPTAPNQAWFSVPSYLLSDESTEHGEKVRHDDPSKAELLLQDAVASCALLQQVVDPAKRAMR